MNLLFINHNPDVQTEIDDFRLSCQDTCFFSINTTETIRILEEHSIDLVIMIINHIRDAAVLKYLSDNRGDIEVLLLASEEYDEIITLFCASQYRIHRLPVQYKNLLMNLDQLVSEHTFELKPVVN